MKRMIIAIFFLLSPSVTSAQSENARTVTVYGESSTQVMPDQVAWKLTLVVREKEQAKLRVKADEIVAQAIAAAENLGLKRNDILVGRVSIGMRYKTTDKDESDQFSHYELTQRMTMVQSDMENYDQFWQALTSIEGLRVSQEFVATNLEEAMRLLRIEALERAKTKASDMAEVVGAAVGRILSISEFKPNPTQGDIDAVAMQRGVVMSAGRPEGITATAKVYAVFELE